jgi:hypothetical protein
VSMKAKILVGIVIAAVGCKRNEPHARLEYLSSTWEGDGPNAQARCQLRLSTDSNVPVWVESGLPTQMVTWQSFDGTSWRPVEDFELDEDGEPVGHLYTLVYESSPRPACKAAPMAIEATIRRCQIETAARVRVGVVCSKDADLNGGHLVFSEGFSLNAN